MHGRGDSHCSGRYASYWNAFLLELSFVIHLLFFIIIINIRFVFNFDCDRRHRLRESGTSTQQFNLESSLYVSHTALCTCKWWYLWDHLKR